MSSRTIAIGDIHGCADAFAGLLSALPVSPDLELVLLGDLIDRGPDTRAVIDRLLKLAGECRLILIRGNHEEMLLRALEEPGTLPMWLACGGAATLDAYGFGTRPEALPREHLDLIESTIDYYETPTHIFLHANYDANLPLDEQPIHLLRWESLRDYVPSRHVSGKTIVVGHTPQPGGVIFDRGYLKGIDTGCYRNGWLTALDAESGEIWQVDPSGRPRDDDDAT